MKALLLAAGYGTRLKPITNFVPKCLVRIRDKPLLAYWLDLLFLSNKIDEVLINTHYLSEAVNTFIETSPWRNHIVLVNEPELLGTGGTILKNRAFFQDGSFLVAHADNLTRFDVSDFINVHEHRTSGIEITMMTFNTDVPHNCGIVSLDAKNIVVNFHEKSSEFHGTKANAAVYIMEPSIIKFLTLLDKQIVDLSTEVLPLYLHRMQAYHNENYHRDIGTPQSLALAEMEF